MTDIWAIFAAVIALFVWDRLPVIAVCVGCAWTLWATGILTLVAAREMAISPQPVLMAVAVAAAAAFLTPVTAPTNLMVMEPGGYRLGDYWKFGLPLMMLYFLVAVGLVPLIWGF